MSFIQLSRQYRGRAVAAMIVAAGLAACAEDQPTAPISKVPTEASSQLGGNPKPNCWPNCAPVARILYVKGDTTLKIGRIWVMNPDKTGQTQLTFGNGDDDYPSWSPDYKKVAFQSKRRGGWEIFVMNADGSNQTPITTVPPGAWDDHPTWSPDGKKIYFTRAAWDAANSMWHGDIYSVNPNGGGLTKVTNYQNVGLFDPTVSPDGKKILVTRTTAGVFDVGHLFTINTDGTGPTQITNTDMGEGMAAWSPDGTKIVLVTNNNYPNYREIATVNTDGTGFKMILARPGPQEHPSWAADGSRIVFVDFGGSNKWGWLFTVKPDGTGLTQLQESFDLGSYYSPSWSR